MISIIRPLIISAISTNTGVSSIANVLTTSPREVWVSDAAVGSVTIYFDLGSPQSFDTVYVGNHNLPANATFSFGSTTAMGVAPVAWLASGAIRLPNADGPRYQSVFASGLTAPARYFCMYIEYSPAQIVQIGTLVIGQSFRHPYAYPAGRQLIDTSRRADLVDGGFGVEDGAVKSAFKWRFTDLTDARRDALWTLISNRGIRRPVIVIEDVSVTPPPEPSVHYGLFDKFEAWERANPVDTIWALSMTEWR